MLIFFSNRYNLIVINLHILEAWNDYFYIYIYIYIII